MSSVLNSVLWTTRPRDLDVVELWSGVESVVKEAQERGYYAKPFDLNRIPGSTDVPGRTSEDILTREGFERALDLVVRVREGGLAGMAPVCSSFIFANTANTKRNRENYRGDERYLPVRQGNQMAQTAAFLMCVALARGVHFFIENPAGSMLFSFLEPTLNLFPNLVYATTDRCAYSLEPYGERFKKPYKFLASGTWLRPHLKSCSCPGRPHARLMETNDAGHITGRTQRMQASASYPRKLGQAIVRAWTRAGSVEQELHYVEVSRSAGSQPPAAGSADPWWVQAPRGPDEESPSPWTELSEPSPSPWTPGPAGNPPEDPWGALSTEHEPEHPWGDQEGDEPERPRKRARRGDGVHRA